MDFVFKRLTEWHEPFFGIIPGTAEDFVWFEDRWMVASSCDE
jgi:hypothetical protein